MPQTQQPEAIFKPYRQRQLLLLPPNLDELIPPRITWCGWWIRRWNA